MHFLVCKIIRPWQCCRAREPAPVPNPIRQLHHQPPINMRRSSYKSEYHPSEKYHSASWCHTVHNNEMQWSFQKPRKQPLWEARMFQSGNDLELQRSSPCCQRCFTDPLLICQKEVDTRMYDGKLSLCEFKLKCKNAFVFILRFSTMEEELYPETLENLHSPTLKMSTFR